MINDRVSNMLSSIKNASMVNKAFIEMPHTIECEGVAKVLESRGFVKNVKTFKEKDASYKMLHIEMAYAEDRTPVLTDLKRVSKPGHRKYKKSTEVGKYRGGYGFYVVSTSRGLMDGDTAFAKKLGGEVICLVY